MNHARQTWEFRWPVPAADLQAIEVVELRRDADGQVRWPRQRPLPVRYDDACDDWPVPVLRLSFVDLAHADDAATAVSARGVFGTIERLGLLAAGTLIGIVVAVAGVPDVSGVEGTTDAQAPAIVAAAPDVARPVVTTPVRRAEPSAAPARAASARGDRPATGAAAGPARSATVSDTRARRAPMPAARLAETAAPLGIVQRYASATSRLDAGATHLVWPSADRQALVATFTALREQRLTLAGCTALVEGDRATVACRGTLRYRPRVGDHSTRVQQGRWRFALTRRSGDWVIATVTPP